jgi:hypothetical protein
VDQANKKPVVGAEHITSIEDQEKQSWAARQALDPSGKSEGARAGNRDHGEIWRQTSLKDWCMSGRLAGVLRS